MVVVQIALGIVLGVLGLRFLQQILAIGVARIALAGVIALAAFLWIAAHKHSDVIAATLGGTAAIVALWAVVQYTARGLGHLYVKLRPGIRQSGRGRNFLRLLGVEEEWLTSALPAREIARAVGDTILMGAFRLVLGYFFAWMLLVLVAVQFLPSAPAHPVSHELAIAVIVVCTILPGVAMFLWLNRGRDSLSHRPTGAKALSD